MRQNQSLKKNNNTWFINTRNMESFEDVENQGRIYKLFHNYNTHNIYRYIKIHKNCLGDIQDLFRNKLAKQDQLYIDENKQKFYNRYCQKLKRQMLLKNQNIHKNITDYFNQYKEDHYIEVPVLQQQQVIKNNIEKDKILTKISTSRPFSSNLCRGRVNSFGSPSNRPIIKNLQPASIDIQLYKSVNIQQSAQQIQKRTNNSQQIPRPISKTKYFYVNNQQIFIQQKQIENQDIKNKKLYSTNIYLKPFRRQQQLRHTYRKQIQQKQKQQLKNKIFMISSALAVNLTKSQGYKPKSQCWQKYCL